MEYKEHLINGIRVVTLKKAAKSANIEVTLSYKLGSNEETNGFYGASHLLEHCVFLGTKKYPDREKIERNLISFGGDYNAATGRDITLYYLSGVDQDLEAITDTLLDLTQNPLIAEDDAFKTEKQVVLAEMLDEMNSEKKWTNPDSVAYESIFNRPDILGTEEDVKNMTASDLLSFAKNFYSVKNSCLFIVSSLDHDQVVSRISSVINEYLKALSPQKKPINLPPPASLSSKLTVSKIKTNDQTIGVYLYFIFDSVRQNEELHAKLKNSLAVLSDMLFFSELSLIYGSLRKSGLIYSIDSKIDEMNSFSIFDIQTQISSQNVSAFCDHFHKGINSLINGKFDLDLFNISVKHQLFSLEKSIEESEPIIESLERRILLQRPTALPVRQAELIREITPVDVQNLAKNIFTTPHSGIVISGRPKHTKKKPFVEAMLNIRKL